MTCFNCCAGSWNGRFLLDSTRMPDTEGRPFLLTIFESPSFWSPSQGGIMSGPGGSSPDYHWLWPGQMDLICKILGQSTDFPTPSVPILGHYKCHTKINWQYSRYLDTSTKTCLSWRILGKPATQSISLVLGEAQWLALEDLPFDELQELFILESLVRRNNVWARRELTRLLLALTRRIRSAYLQNLGTNADFPCPISPHA